MIRPAFIALLVLALAGCGFHLRSALSLPPDLGPVQVVARDPYSPLPEALAQALGRSGAEVRRATRQAENTATLAILSERWASTPISIDARGRAQEYALRYAVVFRLQDAAGEDLVPQQAVELSRDYVASPDDLIGTDSERDLLERELQREMTASIIRRIDGASRQPMP
ncbi:LPS assembly lipoprotein LptE [Luteimonas sp. RD2P54]|uniref:LPS-assembly lipoprotein LptE n=1 Tax=Luteimonas endophytica TaxID=3042023 RepID=A0ABT6J978_9GAMM|nr:LPS assembly lipoprotein LptE [Luteimonas endophytica]MDH5823375.1 LPS assembly lipoprotein LptE [Luteimonas endophytica]